MGGAGAILTETNTVAHGAQGAQVGAYPTSYIPTAGNPVTRLREKLFSEDVDTLLPNAYFNVTLKVAPNFSIKDGSSEQTAADYHLLFLEEKTKLYIHRDDRKLYLKIESVVVSSDPLSFAREQELTITIEHKDAADILLKVEGATGGNGTYIGMPAETIDTTKILYILGKDTGAEECGDLRYIEFK